MPTDDLSPDLGTVLSLDNVPVELPLARVGSRVLAGVLDYFLLFLVLLAWSAGVLGLDMSLGLRPGWGIAVWLLGMFALEYGYFAAQEAAFDGRTVGKRVFGLRVVARDGAAAGTGALLVRNIVRSLDLLVGVLLMAIDPLSRRLGDRLAGTLVVHQRQASEELVVARLPPGWSAAETQLVESYLRRARELEPQARLALGRRLERWIDDRAPGFLPGLPGPDPLPRLWNGFRQESR
ncbi:MAG TPA: RDD family protein [Thermoanaerobaculia bacterium]|jgi:uncharacterized RDD family membrane protein YckC|nr:RDD family protein [Thermoanaerobaculia bacterium]